MYQPELQGVTKRPDSVIVRTSEGIALGRFHGNSRPESESFEISVLDPMTGKTDYTSFFHKEDIWKHTLENWERLRD